MILLYSSTSLNNHIWLFANGFPIVRCRSCQSIKTIFYILQWENLCTEDTQYWHIIKPSNEYWIRWWTPTKIVDLFQAQSVAIWKIIKWTRRWISIQFTRKTGSASWHKQTLRVVSIRSVTNTRLSRPLEYKHVNDSFT